MTDDELDASLRLLQDLERKIATFKKERTGAQSLILLLNDLIDRTASDRDELIGLLGELA